MSKQTHIFIGRSGSGKGTQAKLLHEHLEGNGVTVKYIATGQAFRDFIQGEGYTQKLSKGLMDEGKLQPEFLSVWVWGGEFIAKLEGNEDIILDGTPRTLSEAKMLSHALAFYGFTPNVFHLDISHDEAVKRLTLRGRADDKDEKEVEERLRWFQEDVVPAIEYFKSDDFHNFFEINGVGDEHEIHKTIKEKL
tara:strand:+ start:18306 stop:18884 length:579 start_codon:yes stop_codon:yes gene_type:complete